MDYSLELKKIEDEVASRTAKRNQLQGLLDAKKSELAKIEEEIKSRFGCEPEELVEKAVAIKQELEKSITEMKTVLGI